MMEHPGVLGEIKDYLQCLFGPEMFRVIDLQAVGSYGNGDPMHQDAVTGSDAFIRVRRGEG
jgi:hypothetical protein